MSSINETSAETTQSYLHQTLLNHHEKRRDLITLLFPFVELCSVAEKKAFHLIHEL